MAVSCPLLVLLGPTASGKSGLAMRLAETVKAEILSLDSMQVYRGMDIGTAKPTADERATVPHHLVDLVEPDTLYSVAQFVTAADEIIAQASRRNVPLVVTGGTPLYYKALFEGLFEGPSADPALRDKLLSLPQGDLTRRLAEVDPAAAERIHPNDSRRLVRALEVHELTGHTISDLQAEWGRGAHRHKAVWIGLHWERDALNRRINARTREMISAGWVDETRALLERYGRLSRTAGEATGYRELIDHLEGRAVLDDAIEQIKISTRQLARRQMKWFRRFPDVTWLDGSLPLATLLEQAMKLWR